MEGHSNEFPPSLRMTVVRSFPLLSLGWWMPSPSSSSFSGGSFWLSPSVVVCPHSLWRRLTRHFFPFGRGFATSSLPGRQLPPLRLLVLPHLQRSPRPAIGWGGGSGVGGVGCCVGCCVFGWFGGLVLCGGVLGWVVG